MFLNLEIRTRDGAGNFIIKVSIVSYENKIFVTIQ